jgi:hypothetical protein
VPRLLGDVDAHQLSHQRLQLVVVHHAALDRVEDLLADERRDPQQGTTQGEWQKIHGEPLASAQLVGTRSHPVDDLAEHRHVPALVAHLGEGVVDVGGPGVLVHELAEQGAVEQVLEPDAHGQDVRHLLARQLDALRLGHLVPVGRAEQGHDLRWQEELVRVDGGVPVDVHLGLVRPLDRSTQQALGDDLTVDGGGHGSSREM